MLLIIIIYLQINSFALSEFVSTTTEAAAAESKYLPYVLQQPQQQQHSIRDEPLQQQTKRYTLLSESSNVVHKQPEEENLEQNTDLIATALKPWRRLAHNNFNYGSADNNWPLSHNIGHYPALISLVINLCVLGYLLFGVLGLLQRILTLQINTAAPLHPLAAGFYRLDAFNEKDF